MSDDVNKMLDTFPNEEDVCNVVFSMNKYSAPGPDHFDAFFFHTYLNIVGEDHFIAM